MNTTFGLVLWILSIVLLSFIFVAYFEKNKEPESHIVNYGKLLFALLFIVLVFQTVFYFYLSIKSQGSLDYYYYYRPYLFSIVFIFIALFLYINFNDEVKVIISTDNLKKLTYFLLITGGIFLIFNEVRSYQIQTQAASMNPIESIVMQGSVDINIVRYALLIVTTLIALLGLVLNILNYRKETYSKNIFIVLLIPFIAIMSIIGYLVFNKSFVSSAMIYQGAASDAVEEGFGVIGKLMDSILGDPYIQITVTIIAFGAIARALAWNKAFITFGNLAITFMPTLVWTMMAMKVIPVPTYIKVLFSGWLATFGWLFYIMVVGAIFLIITSMILMFTSPPT